MNKILGGIIIALAIALAYYVWQHDRLAKSNAEQAISIKAGKLREYSYEEEIQKRNRDIEALAKTKTLLYKALDNDAKKGTDCWNVYIRDTESFQLLLNAYRSRSSKD